MSKFTELIAETLAAYKEDELGDAFNWLSDASIELERETLERLEEGSDDSIS